MPNILKKNKSPEANQKLQVPTIEMREHDVHLREGEVTNESIMFTTNRGKVPLESGGANVRTEYAIPLRGRWLYEAGFHYADKVHIVVLHETLLLKRIPSEVYLSEIIFPSVERPKQEIHLRETEVTSEKIASVADRGRVKNYRSTTTRLKYDYAIPLFGKWLCEAGFHEGDKLHIIVLHETLLIKRIPPETYVPKDTSPTIKRIWCQDSMKAVVHPTVKEMAATQKRHRERKKTVTIQ